MPPTDPQLSTADALSWFPAAALESRTIWLPGSLDWLPSHRQAGQQPDHLCGPYWIALLLRHYLGRPLTPAAVGAQAATVLPSETLLQGLPEGAKPHPEGRAALPTTPRAAEAGTSLPGLIHATSQLSEGGFCLIPLQGSWQYPRLQTLMAICLEHPDWQAVPLLNIQTRHLWGANLPPGDGIAYLQGTVIQPPPPDWAVGHFVTLVGQVEGPQATLAILRDSYPHFGCHSALPGHHLQPYDRLTAALERSDGGQGGIALFMAASHRLQGELRLQAAGWAIAPWDNGTPWPPRV